MSSYTFPCEHDRVVVGAVIASMKDPHEFIPHQNLGTFVEKALALMKCIKCGELTEEAFSIELLGPLRQQADIALGVTHGDSKPTSDS